MFHQRLVRYRDRIRLINRWNSSRELTIAEDTYERRPMLFQFRLESVLKLRQREREHERQSAAFARKRHAEFIARRDTIVQKRLSVISELRQMTCAEVWVSDHVQRRQSHIEILNQDLLRAEVDVAIAETQLAECLKRLISADQAARALERLAELQSAEFRRKEDGIELRRFEDLAKPDRRVA